MSIIFCKRCCECWRIFCVVTEGNMSNTWTQRCVTVNWTQTVNRFLQRLTPTTLCCAVLACFGCRYYRYCAGEPNQSDQFSSVRMQYSVYSVLQSLPWWFYHLYSHDSGSVFWILSFQYKMFMQTSKNILSLKLEIIHCSSFAKTFTNDFLQNDDFDYCCSVRQFWEGQTLLLCAIPIIYRVSV